MEGDDDHNLIAGQREKNADVFEMCDRDLSIYQMPAISTASACFAEAYMGDRKK
jgi:hypothetical protein